MSWKKGQNFGKENKPGVCSMYVGICMPPYELSVRLSNIFSSQLFHLVKWTLVLIVETSKEVKQKLLTKKQTINTFFGFDADVTL